MDQFQKQLSFFFVGSAVLNECHIYVGVLHIFIIWHQILYYLYISLGFTNSALQHSFGSVNEAPFYLWGSSTSGLSKLSVTRPFGRATTKLSQVSKLMIHVCPSTFYLLIYFSFCIFKHLHYLRLYKWAWIFLSYI